MKSGSKFPCGWQQVQVSDVCSKIEYGHTASADFSSHGTRLLRISDIQNGGVDWGKVPGCSVSPDQEEAKKLQHGDIVFARTGGTTGKSFLIEHPPPAVFASYLIRLRPNSLVMPEYLYQFFQSTEYWTQVRAFSRGGAQPNVNAQMLGNIVLPLPPLPEQRRIVSILNEQLAAVETAKAAAVARLEAARALPAAYLRQVFGGPGIQNWPRKPLEEVSELLPARSVATSGDVEVTAITTACLTEVGFDPAGVKPSRMWAEDAEVSKVQLGEVLIARSNTPDLVGRVAMFAGEPSGVVASDLTIRIKASPVLLASFLTFYLSSLYLSRYWMQHAGGASGSMKKITRTQIKALKVPLPPLEDQEAITSLIQGQISCTRGLVRTILEQDVAVDNLPSAILRKAFNGEL